MRRAGLVLVVFRRKEEDSFVFLVGTAAGSAAQVVCEVPVERNACPVRKPTIGGTPTRATLNQGAAVPLIGSGFGVRIEHAASGTAHLRIEGVHLNFDLANRFDGGCETCPV